MVFASEEEQVLLGVLGSLNVFALEESFCGLDWELRGAAWNRLLTGLPDVLEQAEYPVGGRPGLDARSPDLPIPFVGVAMHPLTENRPAGKGSQIWPASVVGTS